MYLYSLAVLTINVNLEFVKKTNLNKLKILEEYNSLLLMVRSHLFINNNRRLAIQIITFDNDFPLDNNFTYAFIAILYLNIRQLQLVFFYL